MTPEKGNNSGSDEAAVALEEEEKREATVAESAGGQDGSAPGDTSKLEVKESAGEVSPPAGDAQPDSVKKAEFQEVSATPVKDKAANLDLLLDVVVPVSVSSF